jgi:UDP-MurNAc hydroxylase
LPDGEIAAVFGEKRRYLEAYAAREKPALERAHRAWPRSKSNLLEALKAWWEPLLALADHICEGVGAPVLIDLGEEKILIDFIGREVRAFAGEECRYRFSIERTLVEALVAEHEIDWVNSLFLSMRFRAKRRGQYNEYVFCFFKCLSAERISYAEGWYAEKDNGDDLVELGGYMVQRRCPHLKADLSRFGTVCDGVLECAMHGWRFELETGRCLTAAGHDIIAAAIEPSS